MAKKNVLVAEGYTILFMYGAGDRVSDDLTFYETQEEAIKNAKTVLEYEGEVGVAFVCALQAVVQVEAVPTVEIKMSEMHR